MYSHGSSARAGIGKRGHGGREYRPPRQRRDPTTTPPPLKRCACLCQLDLPEYATTASTRIHVTFGGREALQNLERQLRSLFLVHLVAPGRKQAGPVAVVGQTHHQALPAAAYLLQRLARAEEHRNHMISGRIQRRVQDPSDVTLEGHWYFPPPLPASAAAGTSWIFQCPDQWNVMACFFKESQHGSDQSGDNAISPLNDTYQAQEASSGKAGVDPTMLAMETLQISIDNFRFRMGKLESIEVILHDDPFIVLGAGSPMPTKALYEDVQQSLAKLQLDLEHDQKE